MQFTTLKQRTQRHLRLGPCLQKIQRENQLLGRNIGFGITETKEVPYEQRTEQRGEE